MIGTVADIKGSAEADVLDRGTSGGYPLLQQYLCKVNKACWEAILEWNGSEFGDARKGDTGHVIVIGRSRMCCMTACSNDNWVGPLSIRFLHSETMFRTGIVQSISTPYRTSTDYQLRPCSQETKA